LGDRSSGEKVKPKEFIIIKCMVRQPYSVVLQEQLNTMSETERMNCQIYLAGVASGDIQKDHIKCCINSDGVYGVYRISETELIVCTERSAVNMAYQDIRYSSSIEVTKIGRDFNGSELIDVEVTVEFQSGENETVSVKSMSQGRYESTEIFIIGKPVEKKKFSVVSIEIDVPAVNRDTVFMYAEPESTVIARSGEVCVVKWTDQWFLNYGEEEWKTIVTNHIESDDFRVKEETRADLEDTISWLREWACSRSSGFGTYLPWDNTSMIESLSDSTIYMAYYTVSHLLQGNVEGTEVGPLGIAPDQLTMSTWDYIFLGLDYDPSGTSIPEQQLQKLRTEFEYWYPFDLRVSGKDLLRNHLTMCLFNHAALWNPNGTHHRVQHNMMPRSIFCNGYVKVNNEKMSKSKGNFITLEQALDTHSADAIRFAMADAGDTHADANYSTKLVEVVKDKLVHLVHFCDKIANKKIHLRSAVGNDEMIAFSDNLFQTRIESTIVNAKRYYEELVFREALRISWFELQSAKDHYIYTVGDAGMREDLANRFVEVITLLMSPITPHICEYIWKNCMNRSGSICVDARFPEPDLSKINRTIVQQYDYVEEVISSVNNQLNRARKNKSNEDVPEIHIIVSNEYKDWQKQTLNVMKQIMSNGGPETMAKGSIMATELARCISDKKLRGLAMSFYRFKQQEYEKTGDETVLNDQTPFDEKQVLTIHLRYICDKCFTSSTNIYLWDQTQDQAPQQGLNARPQYPVIIIK
jgi:leucyl-tRNA synthetase